MAEESASDGVPSLVHLKRLTDDVGIVQHALYDIPNRSTGYCTDDVARALMLAVAAHRRGDETADTLEAVYLSFLHDAQQSDGRFHNFMSYDRRWLDDVGGGDSIGRAIWALGYTERFAVSKQRRECSAALLDRVALEALLDAPLRSISFTALGLTHAALARRVQRRQRHEPHFAKELHAVGSRLLAAFAHTRSTDWQWFEPMLTYDNARLCEALLRIGTILDDGDYLKAGLQSLNFYLGIVVEDGTFVPIGSDGWYPRGGYRSRRPQQPLEAAAVIDAASVAYALTNDASYRLAAHQAYAWFLGKNTVGKNLIHDGGCADGIDGNRVSRNMGAESTLAYLAASYAMELFNRNEENSHAAAVPYEA